MCVNVVCIHILKILTHEILPSNAWVFSQCAGSVTSSWLPPMHHAHMSCWETINEQHKRSHLWSIPISLVDEPKHVSQCETVIPNPLYDNTLYEEMNQW